MRWQWNEFQQVGKDYSQSDEVRQYDSSHADFRDAQAEARQMLAKLNLQADARVVEIGTGTGTFALEAAKQGMRVLALDVSQAMLDAAAMKLKEASVEERVELRLQGFLTFDHPPGEADAVVSSFALHHLPDYWKGQALQRIVRTLKVGGQFLLQDVVFPDEGAEAAVDAFIDRQTQRGGDFLRDDAIQHFREEYSTYDWIMRQLMGRAGLNVEQVEWSEGVIAQYRCSK